MIWVILCKDKPNSFEKRMGIIDEHRRYLASNPIKTLISGPLTDVSGKVMNSSFFMVEADTENEVKEFQSNDQFLKLEFGIKLQFHRLIKELIIYQNFEI